MAARTILEGDPVSGAVLPRPIADDVAAALEGAAPVLAAAVTDELAAGYAPAAAWDAADRVAVTAVTTATIAALVRLLRVGDVESHQLERLRAQLRATVPKTDEEPGIELLTSERTRLLALAARHLGDALPGDGVRLLERTLEDLLDELRGPVTGLADDPSDLDDWLHRVLAGGVDAQ